MGNGYRTKALIFVSDARYRDTYNFGTFGVRFLVNKEPGVGRESKGPGRNRKGAN
jgi:hypothetical protein